MTPDIDLILRRFANLGILTHLETKVLIAELTRLRAEPSDSSPIFVTLIDAREQSCDSATADLPVNPATAEESR